MTYVINVCGVILLVLYTYYGIFWFPEEPPYDNNWFHLSIGLLVGFFTSLGWYPT